MFLGEIFSEDLLVVVIVIAVVIFGGSAIPKLARNLGQAKSEFEKGVKSSKTSDAAKSVDPDPKAPDTDK